MIGRTKKENNGDDDNRPCFVALYDVNTPHISGEEPTKILDFVGHKIVMKNLDVDFLLLGKDLVIDNLESVTIEEDDDGHIIVKGKQKR